MPIPLIPVPTMAILLFLAGCSPVAAAARIGVTGWSNDVPAIAPETSRKSLRLIVSDPDFIFYLWLRSKLILEYFSPGNHLFLLFIERGALAGSQSGSNHDIGDGVVVTRFNGRVCLHVAGPDTIHPVLHVSVCKRVGTGIGSGLHTYFRQLETIELEGFHSHGAGMSLFQSPVTVDDVGVKVEFSPVGEIPLFCSSRRIVLSGRVDHLKPISRLLLF